MSTIFTTFLHRWEVINRRTQGSSLSGHRESATHTTLRFFDNEFTIPHNELCGIAVSALNCGLPDSKSCRRLSRLVHRSFWSIVKHPAQYDGRMFGTRRDQRFLESQTIWPWVRGQVDKVVVANGHYRFPRFPDIPGLDRWLAAGKAAHSAWYRRSADPGNRPLVVDGGPGGRDIATETTNLPSTPAVHFSIAEPPLGPLRNDAIQPRARVTQFLPLDGEGKGMLSRDERPCSTLVPKLLG